MPRHPDRDLRGFENLGGLSRERGHLARKAGWKPALPGAEKTMAAAMEKEISYA